MCGILAALGLTGDPQVNRDKVLRLVRLLRHRGPDASGIWASPSKNVILAHERLSIIDRSDAGKQPFSINTPNGNLAWIINSEIYNHKQIRKELLSDSKIDWTGSDSAVLGYLYEKFGPSAKVLEAMDGIFCGVVYDEAKDEYFAFRDHMGICPLYYGKGSDGSTWFASEMRALQEVCDADLQCFPPGFMLSSRTGKLERWYKPAWIDESYIPTNPVDYGHVKDLVIKAVVKRLMSDVPLAVFLSGGLDSSLVASIAARHMPLKDGKRERLHTFSIGIKGAPDLAAAQKVANHINSVHHEFYMTVEEGIDALQEIVYYLESYQQIRAATPHYLLARKVKAMGYKVVLSGEGADEALGGYLYFHKAPSPEEFHKETVRKTLRLHQWDVLRANKACYAWGLEPRVPFLDLEFLDCVMNIAPKDKVCNLNEKPDGIHPRMEKWILRKAFDTPEDPYLPEDVLYRQKEQFSDGVGYDWVDGLKEHAEKVISDEVWATRFDRFPVDTPRSKEYFILRTFFHNTFTNPFSIGTVATGLSIACSTPEAVSWDPAWKDLHEISGRAINVHSASESFNLRDDPLENGHAII